MLDSIENRWNYVKIDILREITWRIDMVGGGVFMLKNIHFRWKHIDNILNIYKEEATIESFRSISRWEKK